MYTHREYHVSGRGVFGRNRTPKFFSLTLFRQDASETPHPDTYLAGCALQAAREHRVKAGTVMHVSWTNVEMRDDGIIIKELRPNDAFAVEAVMP